MVLGEFGLIEKIKSLFGNIDHKGMSGIGDDCAVIPISESESLVISTDMLNEGVHFLMDGTSPYDLGYKSLAVNLSDISAMGATPISSFLSIALSDNVDGGWIDEFTRGYYDLSFKHGVALLGGDTTRSVSSVSISVTVIGRVKTVNIKQRSMASIGDKIFVSGYLGDSSAGLRLMLEKNLLYGSLVKQHIMPKLYIEEGVWLGAQNAVGAMMDVSDGVAGDLKHILKNSGVGAYIDLDLLPLSAELSQVCRDKGWDINTLSLSGGEDYVLLFTVSDDADKFCDRYKERFGYAPYMIGEIVEGDTIEFSTDIQINGFTHF